MATDERLKQFELDGVVQVNPSDDIEYELGRGSYGFVVEMRYRGLKCAGKNFYQDLYCHSNVEARERIITSCYEECLLLCSLSHPNIVQFIGITFEGGNPLPLLVMEFVPFTLSTFLNENGILPQDINFGILVDVATGLCYLHGKKPTIIHRDLSANNILLTSEMKAKIADLGMAKILNAAPAKSKCPGTVTYMPPEALVENPEYRTEIDLFSYGVLIIHVLCAQWPHPGAAKKHDKDGRLVANSEYERRSKYIEILDKKHPMIGLIQRCLSDEPGKRPNADVILRCVQDSASRFPRQFESILAVRRHISSLTQQLAEVQKQLKTLHQESTKAKLKYDMLNAQVQHCKDERSILSKKLNNEIEKGKIRENQHHLTAKLKEAELEQAREKHSLLHTKELKIHDLKEAMQTKETKAKNGELKEDETTMKCELDTVDSLRVQIDSLQKQLDAKTHENEKLRKGHEQLVKVSNIIHLSKLLENMNLELKILKDCEITNLQAELIVKDSYISELLAHQQRAQDYLCSQDKVFLGFKFKVKQCEDLPMVMSDPQCAVIEDRVYVGGGTGDDKSEVFEYSLIEKRWNVLTHNPARYFGLTNFLGELVSVGGILSSTSTITGNVSIFNFAEKSWKDDKISPLPTKRFHPTVIAHGKYLAVCGGVTQGGSTTDVVEVLVGNQWCRGPRLPHRICYAKHAIVDHSCYLVGGAFSHAPSGPSNALISIPLSFLLSDSQCAESKSQWEEHRKQIYSLSSHDDSHYFPAIANHGGILLMVGGWNHKLMAPTANVFAYSSEANVWIKVQELPEPICSLAASTQLRNGAIMLIGGVDSKGKSSRVFLMSQKL